MINNKLKIKILSYWIENPNKTGEIPNTLKNKIDGDDVKNLIHEMNLNYGSFIAYRRELEKDVRDIESSQRHREIIKFQKTQVFFTEILALATLALALNVFIEIFGVKVCL